MTNCKIGIEILVCVIPEDGFPFDYHSKPCFGMTATSYLSINSVRSNGPTLCPYVWPPYVPESVEKLSERATWPLYTNG